MQKNFMDCYNSYECFFFQKYVISWLVLFSYFTTSDTITHYLLTFFFLRIHSILLVFIQVYEMVAVDVRNY